MKKLLLLIAFAAAAFGADGFVPLFNGKNLDGWDGDPRLWSVKDGMIVGSTDGVSLEHNEFLISKKTYSNFILRADMKLRNHNSGIQFRSQALPEWVVAGYQADAAENNYWGCLYEEKGKRGVMVNGWKDKGEKVVKLKDWNTYEILCDGDHIQIKLNGLVTADLHDSVSPSGVIAMQLHRGPPMQAYFRNIEIKILK
jgi:Domain of Unknown Function (DUF1080)